MRVARWFAVCGAAIAFFACSSPRSAAKPAPAPAPAPPAASNEPVVCVDPDANDLPYYVQLSPDEVAVLEGLVAHGSTNCLDHAKLAAYYDNDPFAESDAFAHRLEQLMWLADHCPTKGQQGLLAVFMRSPPADLVARWEEQVAAHPDDATHLSTGLREVAACCRAHAGANAL